MSAHILQAKPKRVARKAAAKSVALTQAEREWQKKNAATLLAFLWSQTIANLKLLCAIYEVEATTKDMAVEVLYLAMQQDAGGDDAAANEQQEPDDAAAIAAVLADAEELVSSDSAEEEEA
jgi:hypothetical protein